MGLGLDMARAGAGQHGHPTVSAEDLLSVNRGKKKKLVTELIVRLATPSASSPPGSIPARCGVQEQRCLCLT